MNQLEDAKRVGYEAENIAGDIKVNLAGQTDKIKKIHSNVHQISGNLTVSNRIMDAIKRGNMKNKLILYFVVLMLIASVALIIYFKFID